MRVGAKYRVIFASRDFICLEWGLRNKNSIACTFHSITIQVKLFHSLNGSFREKLRISHDRFFMYSCKPTCLTKSLILKPFEYKITGTRRITSIWGQNLEVNSKTIGTGSPNRITQHTLHLEMNHCSRTTGKQKKWKNFERNDKMIWLVHFYACMIPKGLNSRTCVGIRDWRHRFKFLYHLFYTVYSLYDDDVSPLGINLSIMNFTRRASRRVLSDLDLEVTQIKYTY